MSLSCGCTYADTAQKVLTATITHTCKYLPLQKSIFLPDYRETSIFHFSFAGSEEGWTFTLHTEKPPRYPENSISVETARQIVPQVNCCKLETLVMNKFDH